MNGETQVESNEEKALKLLIDKPSDFKFHAAYTAYSETWDKTSLEDNKKKLNELITSLLKDEISYQDFYKSLDQFRRPGSKHYDFSRERIETQRKRDWRKKQTKNMRNDRYR